MTDSTQTVTSTDPPVEINDPQGSARAVVSVARGFNCFAYEVDGVDVLDADPGFAGGVGRPSGHGIPILFPFPNRIRDGAYTWNSIGYQLPVGVAPDDGQGNAIHGFCLDLPWRLVSQESDRVTGVFQLSLDAPDRRPLWPADARIRVTYQLADQKLLCDIVIDNPEGEDLPFGFGTHPYFRLPLGSSGQADSCRVHVPAHRQWNLDACLPDGTTSSVESGCDLRSGGRFGDMQLDHVLTGIGDASLRPLKTLDMRVTDAANQRQLVQSCDGGLFREVVVYTPPGRDAVCLEPYTCVTDAINLDPAGDESGWQVLPAGASWETRIELFTSPLEASRVLN